MARSQAPPSPSPHLQREQQRREARRDGHRRRGREQRADRRTAAERGKEPEHRSSGTMEPRSPVVVFARATPWRGRRCDTDGCRWKATRRIERPALLRPGRPLFHGVASEKSGRSLRQVCVILRCEGRLCSFFAGQEVPRREVILLRECIPSGSSGKRRACTASITADGIGCRRGSVRATERAGL
jgi:hypothetical protein